MDMINIIHDGSEQQQFTTQPMLSEEPAQISDSSSDGRANHSYLDESITPMMTPMKAEEMQHQKRKKEERMNAKSQQQLPHDRNYHQRLNSNSNKSVERARPFEPSEHLSNHLLLADVDDNNPDLGEDTAAGLTLA